MERCAKDGSFIPWLSQIDNVNRLYQTGKQRSHLGREQRDHHRAYLWNNRPNVTSFEWQTLMSLRECCQGWWDHIKLTYRIFSCLPINLPLFLYKLIYTAFLMHRTHKKMWINSYNTCTMQPNTIIPLSDGKGEVEQPEFETSNFQWREQLLNTLKSSTHLKMAKPT